MSSHNSKHKANNQKARRRGKAPYSRRTKRTVPMSQAPGELNAILGYGTSSSFPLFMTGITNMIKKIFGRKNT